MPKFKSSLCKVERLIVEGIRKENGAVDVYITDLEREVERLEKEIAELSCLERIR